MPTKDEMKQKIQDLAERRKETLSAIAVETTQPLLDEEQVLELARSAWSLLIEMRETRTLMKQLFPAKSCQCECRCGD